jgi:hypothetical protein
VNSSLTLRTHRAGLSSDQRIEPDEKACLFEAFADSGIRRLLVRVYPSAGERPTIHFAISAQ